MSVGASNILGISAKSVDRGRKGPARADSVEAALGGKTVRFDLQRTAQRLLYKPELEAKEQSRVVWCHRTIRTRGEAVSVYRHVEGTGARFGGLSTCGSVWHCPVCAQKITEARRVELSVAVSAAVLSGMTVNLLTLTFPHVADMALPWVMERFGKALQTWKSGKVYRRVFGDAGRKGSIRSLEVTHGKNGWHPHTHDLVFLDRALLPSELDELKRAWVNALFKQGLGDQSKISDMMDYGLDLQDGKYAAEYIAKFGRDAAWGVSAEMTKPHAKAGKVGEFGGEAHYTPFQLLAWAANGDQRAAQLFQQYAECFEGKRMLSWSPGLKKALKLAELELSDEEIAAQENPAPQEEHAGHITPEQLKTLLTRNKMGDFLAYVARCCFDPETAQQDIDDYIVSVAAQAQSHGGAYRQKNYFGPGYSTFH